MGGGGGVQENKNCVNTHTNLDLLFLSFLSSMYFDLKKKKSLDNANGILNNIHLT